MDLDKIQSMWENDSVIDPDNLHDESLKIPQLHCKYYTIYNTITLLRERARDSYNKVKLERYNYYTGKAPAEVYAEEPFPYKVREKDAIQRYIEADEKLTKLDLKIRYYDTTLKFLEEIFHKVPPFIDFFVISALFFSVGAGRDDGFDIEQVQNPLCGVIGFVRETLLRLGQDAGQQGVTAAQIMHLARCQMKASGVAECVTTGVDFGG